MPVFPHNDVQVGLDVVRAPDIDINAGAIGRGLQQLGSGLGAFGAMAGDWEARHRQQAQADASWQAYQRRLAAFDADIRLRSHIGEGSDALEQARAAMPRGASGFAGAAIGEQNQRDEAFLATLPREERPRAAARLLDWRPGFNAQAADYEHQGRLGWETGTLDGAYRGYLAGIAGDPSQFPAMRADLHATIDNASSLSPEEGQALKQRYDAGLAAAVVKALHGSDPDGAARALDPDRSAPDALHHLIPEADRPALVADIQAGAAQARALSQARLAPKVQDAARAYATIGRYDGEVPTEQDFQASYPPVEASRKWQAFQRTQDLGAQVDLIKALPPAEQDRLLAASAPALTGPDFAGQRDAHALLAEAVAANRRARTDDPQGYVTALHPQIGRLWADAPNDPNALRTAIAATSAAMDQLGIAPEQRQLLPKDMVSKAVGVFGDTAKPITERIAPLRDAITATDDPALRITLFRQAMQAGLPRLTAPALAAFGRGENGRAARLLAAGLDEPFANARFGQPGGSPQVTVPSSPLSLRNGQSETGVANTDWRQARSDTALNLAPAVANELGRLEAANKDGLDPISATLYDRLVRRNLELNGNDPVDAHVLAGEDMRLPRPELYAQAKSKVMTDVPAGDGSAANDNGGARMPDLPDPGARSSDKPLFEIPTEGGKAANNNGGTRIPNSPGALTNTPAVTDNPAPAPQQPDVPGTKPRPPAEPGQPRTAPPEPPPRFGTAFGESARSFGRAAGSGSEALAQDFREKTETPVEPSGTNKMLPSIPERYSLRVPFGPSTLVPAEISRFAAEGISARKSGSGPDADRMWQGEAFKTFNGQIYAARAHLFYDTAQGLHRPYYSVGNLDIAFSPTPGPNGEVVVSGIRERAQDPDFLQRYFLGKTPAPDGPWFGDPGVTSDTASEPVAMPRTPSTPTNQPSGSPRQDLRPLTPDSPFDPDVYDQYFKVYKNDEDARLAAQGAYKAEQAALERLRAEQDHIDQPNSSGRSQPIQNVAETNSLPQMPPSASDDAGKAPEGNTQDPKASHAAADRQENPSTGENIKSPTLRNGNISPRNKSYELTKNSPVDTQKSVSSNKGLTRRGIKRNNPQAWRRLRDLWDEGGYQDILSKENRDKIAKGAPPIVDRKWINAFPEDEGLVGEWISMHHIDGSFLAVPLPKTRHRDAHMPGGFSRNTGGPGSAWPRY